jgi:hypothetical protein
MLPRMRTWTLRQLEDAVRSAWALDTCFPSPEALAEWSPANPARGQCGVTALVLHDLLGGDLLLAAVTVDGRRTGWHYWNRLAGGTEVDLTREQFGPHETVGEPTVVTRPDGPPRRAADQYERLRARVHAALTGWPAPVPG